MNTKVLAFVLAAGTALSFGAQAADRSDSQIFCGSIGLSAHNQAVCTQQLESARSANDRQDMQGTWVARSSIVGTASSISSSVVPAGTLLPNSTTHYQATTRFVPNRVVAQINRAKNSVLTTPELKTQAVAAERSRLSATREYAN